MTCHCGKCADGAATCPLRAQFQEKLRTFSAQEESQAAFAAMYVRQGASSCFVREGRRYTIKTVPFSEVVLLDASANERMQRALTEISVAQRIPEGVKGLSKSCALFFTEDAYHLVFERFDGASLRALLDGARDGGYPHVPSSVVGGGATRPLDVARASEIFLQLVEAVDVLHRRLHIAHGAVTEDHVFVQCDAQGTVQIELGGYSCAMETPDEVALSADFSAVARLFVRVLEKSAALLQCTAGAHVVHCDPKDTLSVAKALRTTQKWLETPRAISLESLRQVATAVHDETHYRCFCGGCLLVGSSKVPLTKCPRLRQLHERLFMLEAAERSKEFVLRRFPQRDELGDDGQGGFGAVSIVLQGGMKYALKEISYNTLFYQNRAGVLEARTNINDCLYHLSVEAWVAGSIPSRSPSRLNYADELFFTTDAVYLKLQYVPGHTLLRSINEGYVSSPDGSVCLQFDEALAAEIFVQLLEGVAQLHEREIVHRDLKPENVMVSVDEKGHVQTCIVDFGMCRIVNREMRHELRKGEVPLCLDRIRWYHDNSSDSEAELSEADGDDPGMRRQRTDLPSLITRQAGTPLYMAWKQLAAEVRNEPLTMTAAETYYLDIAGCGAILLCMLHRHRPAGEGLSHTARVAALSRPGGWCPRGHTCVVKDSPEAHRLLEGIFRNTNELSLEQVCKLAGNFYSKTHHGQQLSDPRFRSE